MLLVNGHSSHVYLVSLPSASNMPIDLMILPAHSSHITQPLYAAVFGPLKTGMGRETDRLHGSPQDRLQKADWAGMLVWACHTSMIAANIRRCFKLTGLYPFCPSHLLHTIYDAPSIPEPSCTPLGSIELNHQDKLMRDLSPAIRSAYTGLMVKHDAAGYIEG